MTLSATMNASKVYLGRLLGTPTFSSRQICPIRELHRKSIYKSKEAKKIRFYVLTRYVEYLKNYDKVLEKKFPTTMQTYRVFTDGIKDFTKDTRQYFKMVRLLYKSSHDYSKLLRREIELLHQMPKDMRKVAPILLLSTLPFAFYVILPLIYTFPKQLLCSHFWTLQQKNKFHLEYLQARLYHNKPVFRHLQSQLDFLKTHELYKPWCKVLGMLGSGGQPTPEQILTCKDLFMGEPYHLFYLSHGHVRHLVKLHDVHTGWLRRTRLAERAVILIAMDKAIMREGGVHNLPIEALRKACYIRGLNPANMSNEDMVKWLTNWIKISSQINKDNLSLLLHCPVLLGYNEPSNWRLLYGSKQ